MSVRICPAGIYQVDAFHLPLINTLILLLSGCAVTWAHHALVHENNRKDLINGLAIAVVLGVLFTALQAYEYATCCTKAGNLAATSSSRTSSWPQVSTAST